jgi:hypothetical protein
MAPQFTMNISANAFEIDLADETTNKIEYKFPSIFDTNETQKVIFTLDAKGAKITDCMQFD